MPCDTVQMTEVDVSRYQRHILKAALDDLGYIVSPVGYICRKLGGMVQGQIKGNRLEMYGNGDALERALPKAYSRRLVLHNAKRAGWKVREKAGRIQLFK